MKNAQSSPGGGKHSPLIRTHVRTPSRRAFLLERLVGRVIAFFRKDAPIPIVISRIKLAVAIVVGVITPLVLALSAVVFSSHRRYRKP